MKKLLCILIFIFVFFSSQNNITFAESSSPNYVVSANFLYIYESPDFASTKLKRLENKTEIIVEYETDSPKKYINEEFVFYKVLNFDGVNGFVFCDLVTPKSSYIKSIPNFNAKTNSNCKFFIKQDNNLIESDITLEKNSKLFLYEGFDKKATYTPVTILSNNEIYYGYVETQYVNPNGINPVIITCVTIIIALLGIIFAWLFIKKRK